MHTQVQKNSVYFMKGKKYFITLINFFLFFTAPKILATLVISMITILIDLSQFNYFSFSDGEKLMYLFVLGRFCVCTFLTI